MNILLTNDDGIDSSALLPTIEELEIIGDVSVVVPMFEQSWTSKSNTRRKNNVDFEVREIAGREVHTLDALPADCANFGIYNLEQTPDLVVSGANLGHNLGISAFYSSGTIGAALEGYFAGIPSIAISVPYPSGAKLTTTPFKNAITGIWDFCDRFYRYRDEEVLFVNLNLPYDTVTKKLKATEMANYHYGALFKTENGNLRPSKYGELAYPVNKDIVEGTDVWARINNFGSVVMMNNKSNFVNPSIVAQWLDNHQLTTMGDEIAE